MSSRAIASPAPVLGDFTPTFPLPLPAWAEEPLRELPDPELEGSVLESNNLTASRTRDLRSCEEVGLTGPKIDKKSCSLVYFICFIMSILSI